VAAQRVSGLLSVVLIMAKPANMLEQRHAKTGRTMAALGRMRLACRSSQDPFSGMTQDLPVHSIRTALPGLYVVIGLHGA
jgi:hypothetical protein